MDPLQLIGLIRAAVDLDRILAEQGIHRPASWKDHPTFANPTPGGDSLERFLAQSWNGTGGDAIASIPIPGDFLLREKKKRKPSAYNKRYSKAFKRLAPKYKKKNGSWKKDGFKRCAAAARKEAKK